MIRSFKDVFNRETSIHGISMVLWLPAVVASTFMKGFEKMSGGATIMFCGGLLLGIEWVVRLGLLCWFWIGNFGKGNP